MKETGRKSELWEWTKTILIAVAIAVIFRTFFFSSYVVKGESMMPTLQDGNLLIINKIVYEIGDLNRFDVVVFHKNKQEDYVKRILGLPGDIIEYKDDILYVNGQAYDEPYLKNYKEEVNSTLTGDFSLLELWGTERVPEGQLFVVGDNRRNSFDSRNFGFIPIEDVVGKVDLRYWPMEQFDTDF